MKKLIIASVILFGVATMFTSCKNCKECTYSQLPGSYRVCGDGTLEYCYAGTCVADTSYNGTQQEIIDALEASGFTCN
ncbi:MAG: hypothetical protein N2167_05820 [Flavobacteriales bacterium]|nr:hypothetical protein [Flavobacteriales bacterium]